MKIAMSVLAFGALFAGFVQVPGVDDVVHKFLEGRSRTRRCTRSTLRRRRAWRGLAIGGASRSLGIALAYYVPAQPGDDRGGSAASPLHDFLERKWYFDEAIDILVVRPALAVGRWANSTFERYVVQGLVGGATERRPGRQRRGPRRPVRLPALLRPAAGHRLRRPRPLLPDPS